MGKRIIKLEARPNLKHPFFYLLHSVLRNVESILLGKYLDFTDSFIYTLLMFVGEFFSGLFVFLYQKKFVKKTLFQTVSTSKSKDLELIITNKRVRIIDKISKIIFILLCCAFFDYIQFLLYIEYSKLINLDSRLGGVLLIFDALFYIYALKFSILRHQLFCLIIIGICLLIIIITELIFQKINFFFSYYMVLVLFLYSLLGKFFCAMIDLNEKYLFDYNNVNPFYALLFEGFFGIIFSFIYAIYDNPFKKITKE